MATKSSGGSGVKAWIEYPIQIYISNKGALNYFLNNDCHISYTSTQAEASGITARKYASGYDYSIADIYNSELGCLETTAAGVKDSSATTYSLLSFAIKQDTLYLEETDTCPYVLETTTVLVPFTSQSIETPTRIDLTILPEKYVIRKSDTIIPNYALWQTDGETNS